jgi:nucleotide-binding universal stress UspA family protein
MYPTILIAYDATPEAADGLALGRLLANLVDAELHVARVLPDTPSTEATDRDTQWMFRATLHETQLAAAEGLERQRVELWPVFGTPVAPGIQALAADRGADLIVLGSPHHGPIGRVLLGSTAEAVIAGAPCAVAIAPRGFRRHPAIDPNVIGVAFDGSSESAAALDAGLAIARAADARLRVIAVEPSGWSRPIRHGDSVAAELAHRCAELADDVDIQPLVLHGDPARKLAQETERLGLLVCGSRACGPLHRVMLGSVSTAVIRSAACPVVVVPRRARHPLDALESAAAPVFTESRRSSR